MNIDNVMPYQLVTGSAGNDSIDNWSNNVTIDAGAGNDTISNHTDAKNTSVFAGADNDSISNWGSNNTINAGDGNDSIFSYSASKNMSITGGEGNDRLSIWGNNNTLDGGAGNDSILSNPGSKNSSITGGAGNDRLSNWGSNNTINGGDGNDSIFSYAESKNTSIMGGAGSDTIQNLGNNNTLDGGAGNDSILSNSGSKNSSITGGAGSDTIQNLGSNNTIEGGIGNDSILSHSDSKNTSITGGAGSDTIQNWGSNNTIEGGIGNDSILSHKESENTSILAGAGNDTIKEDATRSTIYGGTGDDIISLGSNSKNALIVYSSGDGNDRIVGFKSTTTLNIADEIAASTKRGDDLIIGVAENELTLVGAANISTSNIIGLSKETLTNSADSVSIIGGNYDDTISNSGANVTILAQGGDDSIKNTGSDAKILAQDGNDTIIHDGNKSTIDAGAGNNYISSSKDSVSISAGEGNDSISISGLNITVNGGAGDDLVNNKGSNVQLNTGEGKDSIINSGDFVTIDAGADKDFIRNSGANVLFTYKASDGNDTIEGFRADSTLKVSGGTFSTVKAYGSVYVTVGGGRLTLRGAASIPALNIIETAANIHNSDANQNISGTNLNDTIINSGENVKILGLGGEDSINNNAAQVSINGGNGKDNISNTGKNVSVAGDTGDDTIYNNAENNRILGDKDNDSIFNHGEKNTINGGSGNDTLENYTNSNEVLLEGHAGNDSIKSHSSKVTIRGNDGNDTIQSNGTANSIFGDDGDDLIILQSSYKNTVAGGKGNDTIQLDSNTNNLFISYAYVDGDDVIEGFNSTSTLQLGKGTGVYTRKNSDDDAIIAWGKRNITLKGAASLDNLHINGVTQLNINNTKNSVSLVGDRLNDNVGNSGNFVTISTKAGNDTISNSGSRNIIDSGENEDSISNSGSQVSINAAGGNDRIIIDSGVWNTIAGGTGNDTIQLANNAENNLIQYSAGDGNDVIEGFNENSTLQLGNGYETYSLQDSGNDLIVNVKQEKITLKGAASLSAINIRGVDEDNIGIRVTNSSSDTLIKGRSGNDILKNDRGGQVTIIGNAGDDYIENEFGERAMIFGNAGDDRVRNTGSNSTIEGGAGNDDILNGRHKGTHNVLIQGGDGDDTLDNATGMNVTLQGGAGNDSLINRYSSNVIFEGGKGNDSLSFTGSSHTVLYKEGDGDDTISFANGGGTLSIASNSYSTAMNGNDTIITVGEGKVSLHRGWGGGGIVIAHEQTGLVTLNTDAQTSLVGTAHEDSITNRGDAVTINAGKGNDSIVNECGFYPSISGGDGDDFITVSGSAQATINAGKGNDQISLKGTSETFIKYSAGNGNDVIYGFDKNTTLNIAGAKFSSATSGNDIILSVGSDKITLAGAATLSNPNIINGMYATFTIKNSVVTYDSDLPESDIKNYYEFKASQLTIDDKLKNYLVTIRNEDDSVKANWNSGKATLKSGSVLNYQFADEKNNVTLASKNYNDQITFSENAMFNYGRIQAEVQKNGTVSTKAANRISFENNSSASITARRNYIIDVVESNITVNDIPINAQTGAGTVTVEKNGLSFEGYGVQLADLEVAKESYFGKLAPMTVDYNSSEDSYTVYNTACVKTLSGDFTKLKFDFKTGTKDSTSSDDKYAYYKINDVAILTTKDEENTSVIEVNDRIFKVDDKELNAEKIGRIILDDKITFSGTKIDFDGLITTYAQNKQVIYSADGNEITISDAATVTVGENTKTFTCAAGSYTVNGRTFETSAALTFTADANEIKIPLNDTKTEIFFGGVKVSGTSGELVFDTVNDKISIPTGATLNITSSEETKLNLAAGEFTINGNKISSDTALEITADKDNIKVPLSENAVTINGAKITGSNSAQIDNAKTIALPDGALVQNVTENLFMLTAKNSAATFGTANKKVQLTEDGTAYIGYTKENGIGVGFNALLFEQVEIQGNDAWTVETSGTSGIDKITGIKSGATLTTSTEYVDAGDLRFEVETDGAGDFTICGEKFTATDKNTYVVRGNSSGEIKASTLADEFKGDDSEAAGKAYNFDKAGDYTVNGITFHAETNSKVQTITRGVEFDLSTGAFQYDGLTLEDKGTAQINRYNARLISLTDGAKVGTRDEGQGTSPQSLTTSPYFNRQFEINGTVELIGKKFETNQQVRCALLNIEETMEGIPAPLIGFVVDDKYVAIQNDCYDSVKVVDKKISSIEGVKATAQISGNGLANASIVATESGEFSIQGKTYKITDDSDGVTFVTDSHGNVAEINGLAGSVEGDFENAISVNGKAIQISGASTIKVTSDGESITEISNVAGDSDGTYRKDVRVYETGGAAKLTTSADGTIIFNGNKFETSAGKTFELDSSGNISGIEKAQVENVSANVLETDAGTINLSTTNGLEEVFGDFSEGITVNGVLVKVTESTNFVVKNDDENIYIETTAPDTFTINGNTFKTQADKTIFKLDKSGNVSEIVTDKFYLYPDENTYLIEGDFNDEIIFNGQKFCVTGTNDTTIFIGEETLIGIELARNSVEVVESGGAAEIALTGGGEITIGDKTFKTSDDFIGVATTSSIENFVGTLSGKLGGVKLSGITITTEDDFSATSDGEKITAIENLQNGSLNFSDLDSVTINGELISLDDLTETTLEVIDGEVKLDDTDDKSAWQKLIEENPDAIIAENTSLEADSLAIVEATAKKISITASKGNDTIYTAGRNVDIDLKSGGATKIYAAEGRATVENYNAKTGAAFLTTYSPTNLPTYNDGRLTVNSAQVIFAEDADSRFINFVDTEDETHKFGFVSDDSKLDASKENGNLILVGASNSTIVGGKGRNQIQLDENSESTILLNGRSTIDNFNATFDGGDKISVDAATTDFSFDGENISVKSGTARATLQNISSDGGAARILTLINGKETKTAIAQAGEVISAGDDLADIYYGKKSGVDFSGFDETLTIDLSENFHGINQVTVGSGLNTLISSSANETLTGNSDGTTEYVFDKNCGRDLIQNFNFDEDKINVGTNAVTNVRINSAGGVRMEIGNVGSVTLDDAQGKNFKINNFTALVDKNLTYNDAANYFVATAQNASVIVNESAEIWLDGSHGKTFVGDIRTLDASTAEGNTSLAGNDLDNTILAGNGDASLWGGNGGDDLLVGGAGKNTFFYLQGNGSDTVQGVHDGDAIILSTVTLDQISGTNFTADGVTINFKDGGSLQVNGNANVTYQLADGSKYTANHEQAAWLTRN